MRWGAIGKGYKSRLNFVEGTLNAKKYRQMLKNDCIFETICAAKSGNTVHFQQDGASCHTAKQTIEFIEKQILLMQWPPNSLDRSLIENVWAILKKVGEREITSLNSTRG
jgi:hypothetical protein